jgi:hypothetical protein
MILYHGSYAAVEKPDIAFSRNNLDFGKGFYTTPLGEQAVNWATRFKRKRGQSIVSSYEFDKNALSHDTAVLTFDSYSDEWLEFIIACRSGNAQSNYDIVIGGIANDKVFDTVQLYLDGLIDKSVSLERLRYDKPNIQYCFCNQDTIDKYLKFIRSEVV